MSYDWADIFSSHTEEEWFDEFHTELEKLESEVHDMEEAYADFLEDAQAYRSQTLFEDVENIPEFAQAEYNYAVIDTCLMRAYLSLRHIEILNDLSQYSSENVAQNSFDIRLTLGSAMHLRGCAERAFDNIAGEGDWQSDADKELTEELGGKYLSLETLNELINDHIDKFCNNEYLKHKSLVKLQPKEDLIKDLNFITHVYSIQSLALVKHRIKYAKVLFNAFSKAPENLPLIEKDGFPHPDLYFNDTIQAAKRQFIEMIPFRKKMFDGNKKSLASGQHRSGLASSNQIKRSLVLFPPDLNL